MALRRMFSLEVVDTDWFLDLPFSAQCLYFHLGMRADDDGFVASPKRLTGMFGCSREDLELLEKQNLIICFPSGVCVIRHWKMNNYLRSDRYKPTVYQSEWSALTQDENAVYQLSTSRYTQDRIGKDRTEEDRREGAPARRGVQRTARSRYGWVRLSDEEYHSLLNELGQEELERCIAYVDESAQATSNKNKWRDWSLVLRRCHKDRWGLTKRNSAPKPAAKSAYDDEDAFNQEDLWKK